MSPLPSLSPHTGRIITETSVLPSLSFPAFPAIPTSFLSLVKQCGCRDFRAGMAFILPSVLMAQRSKPHLISELRRSVSCWRKEHSEAGLPVSFLPHSGMELFFEGENFTIHLFFLLAKDFN